MAIKFSAGFVGGRGPREFAKFVVEQGAIEVRAGVEAATDGLKNELRDQIAEAGLGERLGRAIGANVYPKGGKPSLDAAGYVFPRGKKATAIFDAYNRGVTITAHKGRYLAIPTKEAGRGNRFSKATPQEFQERTGIKLRFVKTKNGNAVLVGDAIKAKSGRGGRVMTRVSRAVIFFVLIRSARVGKKLSFESTAQKWADRMPQLIESAKQGDA
jgi:hypothetical protein